MNYGAQLRICGLVLRTNLRNDFQKEKTTPQKKGRLNEQAAPREETPSEGSDSARRLPHRKSICDRAHKTQAFLTHFPRNVGQDGQMQQVKS
jgi:hypothetical protein